MRAGIHPRRLAVLVMLAPVVAGAGTAGAAGLGDGSLLSAPADYSLAPPALVQGGVIGTSIGSGGMRSTALRLDSGLLGGSTRAFLLLGTGQGPRWRDAQRVSGSNVAVGVQTDLPHGTILSLSAGYERERLTGLRGPGAAGAFP